MMTHTTLMNSSSNSSQKTSMKQGSWRDVKIFYEVLSSQERENLLEQSKPLLGKVSELHPGLQTDTNLNEVFTGKEFYNPFPKFCDLINVDAELVSAWVNCIDSEVKLSWHTHTDFYPEYRYSSVYMLDNPESLGTAFLMEDAEYHLPAPTNSLLVFPSNYTHSNPLVQSTRYTLAMDFS